MTDLTPRTVSVIAACAKVTCNPSVAKAKTVLCFIIARIRIISELRKQEDKMTIRTKQGCSRRISALVRAYQRDFAGGGTFGWDWTTFHINQPERYAEVRALQKLY